MPRIATHLTCIALLSVLWCTGCGNVNRAIIDQNCATKEIEQWGPWTEEDLNRIVDYYNDDADGFFMWVYMNIGYTCDMDGELNTPLKVLNARKGSCVGHSLLFEYYFNRIGLECIVMDIYGDDGNYAHCGCIVPSQMQWYSAHERIHIELEYCDAPKVAQFIGNKLGHTIRGYGYYHEKEYIAI